MHIPRGVLAVAAATIAFSFVPIGDLPASAATVVEEINPAGSSPAMKVAIEVPENVDTEPVARDSYGVEVHSLVSWPLDPNTKISSYFGYRLAPCGSCSSDHQGVDFNPGFGHPIAAIADGIVVATGNPSGELGVHVIVEHVVDGDKVQSVYGHMESGSMSLSVGDVVKRGQILGLVGSTGQSTGPHLHFGILRGGQAIDPLEWMDEHANS